MKHAIIIMMTLIGIMAGLRFGFGIGAPLNYNSASPEQQQQWIDNRSGAIVHRV